MKKIFSCLAAIGCLTMLLTACNNSEDTTADVDLGQYKGIEVTVPGVEEVTEEDIDKYLRELRTKLLGVLEEDTTVNIEF